MPYPLKETYRPGQSINAVPARDLSTIAKILNDLKAVGLKLTKTSSGLGWKLELMTDGTTIEFAADNLTIQIKDGGVGTSQIANDAVDKDKIAADVAGNGLGQNASGALEVNVDGTTIEIATDQLQVATGGVDSLQIAPLAVTTAKLAANAATSDKTTGASGSVDTGTPGTTLTITNGLVTAIT